MPLHSREDISYRREDLLIEISKLSKNNFMNVYEQFL
jgi:hypothetical protein